MLSFPGNTRINKLPQILGENAKTVSPARARREHGRGHSRWGEARTLRHGEQTAGREVDLIAKKLQNCSKPFRARTANHLQYATYLDIACFTTVVLRCSTGGLKKSVGKAPPGRPRPRDRATRAPHGGAHGLIGERTCPNAILGKRGASKGTVWGTACSVPGKGADPRGRQGFQYCRRRFPRGIFFVSPVWGFTCTEDVFFFPGMEHHHPPPGNFLFASAGFLVQR